MSTPVSGTVTFLFTDIEGSTILWERYPEAMKTALAQHDGILRDAVEHAGGRIVKTTGDGLHAVFANALDAVAAATKAQRALAAENWNEIGRLLVRMALHSGSAEQRSGDYYGPALNRAARLMSIAHGGQTLLSGVTMELVHDSLPSDIAALDLGEHRLRDLLRPERVYQLRISGLRSEFPPLHSLNSVPHNLPVQLTSFVGRERELADVKRLLETAHLLTLTGPGGTGKTRLTLQVAAESLHDFPNGTWLVELAALTDPALIEPSIAAALRVREQAGSSLLEALIAYLQTKQLLLLLDNCEHLIQACAQLAFTLLRACPNLKILASSREPLGIAGESVYPVPPLGVPPPVGAAPKTLGAELQSQDLLQYDAVRLFIERARAAQPEFELNAENAPLISQICARLDGIPLAIELASARTRLFSAEEIAARLDDRFRLLTGGSRTALPRHQTLRALVDWSYDLLPGSERVLFRRLSAFAGGWTLAEAEVVCGDPPAAHGAALATNMVSPLLVSTDRLLSTDILDLLAGLVNKSLVIVDRQRTASHYRMLETIRQYARDRLLESGESAWVRERHTGAFLRLVLEAEPRLQGPEESAWSARLEAELGNIRAAIEWALASDPYKALQLLGGLSIFWTGHGLVGEARRWSEQALVKTETLNGLDVRAARAKVFANLASMAFGQGDVPAQALASTESIRIYRELGGPPDMALALVLGAIAALMGSEFKLAQNLTEEGLALARATGKGFALANFLGIKAMIAAFHEDAPAARANAEEAVTVARQTGSRYALALVLITASNSAKQVRDYAQARVWLEECKALYEQIDNPLFVNAARGDLADIARLTGEYGRATELYRENIRVWYHFGQLGGIARCFECLAFIAGAHGKLENAARIFGAAEALRQRAHARMAPDEQAEYESQVQQIRVQAEQAAFAQAWAEGRVLSLDRAIELASTTSRICHS